MKKDLIVHPFLIGLYFILGPLALNLNYLPMQDVTSSLLFTFTLSGFFLIVSYFIAKDWDRAGFVTSFSLIYFFLYGHIYFLLKGKKVFGQDLGQPLLIFIFLSLIIYLFVSKRLWNRLQNKKFVTQVLNLIAAVSLIFPGTQITSYVISNRGQLEGEKETDMNHFVGDLTLSNRHTPDIYYIILDGYGGNDVLSQMYDFDNSDFYSYLINRGFFIADESRANYVRTYLSLSSSLNLDYLQAQGLYGENYSNYERLKDLIWHSQARKALEKLGYKTVSFDSGYDLTKIQDSDYFFHRYMQLNQYEEMLLTSSLIGLLDEVINLGLPMRTYDTHRQRIEDTFTNLKEINTLPGPKFVFAHLLLPHPPFVYTSEGQPRSNDSPYHIHDGLYYFSMEEYKEGYIDQIIYVNNEFEKIIDAIIRESPTPPIIIIQGDHGPRAFTDGASVETSCWWENSSILNAYFFPSSGDSFLLYASISPVNTFRVVFNSFFQADFPILEDKTLSFFLDQTGNFIDVTNKTKQKCRAP